MPSIQSLILGNFDKKSFPVEGGTCRHSASTVKLQCRGKERKRKLLLYGISFKGKEDVGLFNVNCRLFVHFLKIRMWKLSTSPDNLFKAIYSGCHGGQLIIKCCSQWSGVLGSLAPG